MCDSCEFFLKSVDNVVDVSILLLDKIEAIQLDDTCCESAREQMLTVFQNHVLDLNEWLATLSNRIVSEGTEEEQEALSLIVVRYKNAVLKGLQSLMENLTEKTDIPPDLDWKGVFGEHRSERVD